MPKNESSISSTKSLRFLNISKTASQPFRQYTLPDALASESFDYMQGYSYRRSMYNSELPSMDLMSVATSTFKDATFSSTISSLESNVERINTSNDDGEAGPFHMTQTADIGWTLFFGLMIGGAIIGNLVVIWIVLGKECDI